MRKLILSFLLLLFFVNLSAQRIADVLAEMPENIVPTLTEQNKRALLEDSTVTVVPTILGQIRRIDYRDDYIMLQTSAVGSTQIQLLETNVEDEAVICVIQTVCGPACNSNITFYDSNWEQIVEPGFLPEITADHFVTHLPNGDAYVKVETLLPDICPVSALFDENGHLVMKLDVDNYLSSEMKKEFDQSFSLKDLILKWDGQSFR